MSKTEGSTGELTLERLFELHSLTKDVSRTEHEHLMSVLGTLSPLFGPRRYLGDFVDGIGEVRLPGAERNFDELTALYTSIARETFDLRPELRNPIESISTTLQIYPWEYTHNVRTTSGFEAIRVTSPLTWVLAYSSQYSFQRMREILGGKQKRDDTAVRAFVLRACILQLQFEKFPGLVELLTSLRYRFEVRRSHELGALPLATISAPFATVRPPDALVMKASGLAGTTDFPEVIDLESVRQLEDPVKQRINEFLANSNETL